MFIGKTKNFIGKFKIETPKTIWIDEFVCLRSKVYSFKCKKDDEKKQKQEAFLNLYQNILNLKNKKTV